ncbi:phenylalanyl-tRNA synthetase beta chain [Blattabacterium sp. (Blatta orientalis) str. Tarazona]|uniref:phenylalanine--tRNA ligase subunit beta n=1 Tax=Blattabacterium sp. (Blatta orientalis) TaxID=367806 RepID=UPI0002AD9591|nr:phenylalanine--tRNA ligase subunit beta [Blattabacterium sp. (Blatta orientalis)]AGD97961.1 phenylalanyl-tRNA synthetase beta chain [Blattabacterium sp. (Blatta orientalis) str. Tarazona]
MRISYNWLRKYISIDLSAKKISDILTEIGLSVKDVIKKKIGETEDSILDVEITPNRSDAMSHYGIARDLYAVLTFRGYKTHLSKPIISNYQKDINKYRFQISIEEKNKCRRFSGLILSKIEINSSPNWLTNQLESLGIKPINNIIDITNFVMNELGQPIQVFDMDKIEGKILIIKNVKNKIYFNSEDNRKRILNEKDFIISDKIKPLSIAGIINETNLNVNIRTKNIFLGGAYFNPVDIRSIGIRHMIKTDARFRFERGVDPNLTVYALQRTALLIKEVTKCNISSDIMDIYPNPIDPSTIKLRYQKIHDLIGKRISEKNIKKILLLLEIVILDENKKSLLVLVPPYRIDVQREVDLIEEILRIYGLTQIKISKKIQISPLPNFFYKTKEKIQKTIFNQLVNYGFQEIINPPIINKNKDSLLLNSFLKREEIRILNPVNKSYNSMRSSLLFGMIDSIKHNYNRGNQKIKFFEIGKIYYKSNNQFLEKTCLSIALSEKDQNKKKIMESKSSLSSLFFDLKGIIEQIFQRIGILHYTQINSTHPFLRESIFIKYKNKNLVELGKLKEDLFKKQEVFYAEIDWEYLISIIQKKKVIFIPFSKYPTSKRDLSFLVDKTISFEKIYQLIKKKKKIRSKKLRYMIYMKEKIYQKKKNTCTISFFFESQEGTLTDLMIDEVMKKIDKFLKNKLGAKIRGISQ